MRYRGATESATAPNGLPARAGEPCRTVELSAEDRGRLAVLLVDDERSVRESCASVLQHEGYRVSLSRSGAEGVEQLRRQRFDIVIVDLYLTPITGLDVLRAARKSNRSAIVIVITGNPSVSSSIEALRLGAWEYLPKPFSGTQLLVSMGRAAHKLLVGRETRTTGVMIDRHSAPASHEVLGDSPEFRRAIQLARRVAPTDASVFITGESGTGKELVANFIHQYSLRSNRPFVAVNCAALPETLLESEMFGHVKGAFTGAVRDKMGLLEAANGGTMFLDELLEMPKAIQAKLLRVIQDGVVRRLGSEHSDATVNVRFIAATNGSPERAVESGALREDLYYRLQVVPIHLPPLRERQDDIPLLANSFLSHYWKLHRGDAPPPRLAPATLHRLRAHPWRGNVRELQNVFEHAVVLLEPRAEIQPSELPLLRHSTPAPERIAEQVAVRMAQQGPATAAPVAAQAENRPPTPNGDTRWREEPYHAARDRLIADFERGYLLWLVNHTAGNLTKAARIAGVERTTLYRMMERHGLQRMTVTVSVE